MNNAEPIPAIAAPVFTGDGQTASAGRALDIAFSALILAFALPVMVIVALAIYVEDGGPVLFVQPRVGLGRRTFRVFKFRSMVPNAEEQLAGLLSLNPDAYAEWTRTQKLQKDPRITVVGRLIRKLSLDELPQLANVLKGDMALVGPRPIVESEAIRYGRWINYYCAVRPGLTGLWQVKRLSNTG